MAQDEKQVQKRNRITYMILSVVIAIAAWALVAFANNPDITVTFHDVDVVFRGAEELQKNGLIVVNESEIPSLEIKVRGKRNDLVYAIDKTVVEVDLSGITKQGEYNLKGNVVLPNSGTSVEKVKFSSVPVTVDLYREKELSVSIVQTGGIEGKIVKSVPEVKSVEIEGAKTELDMISHAVVNVDLALLSATGVSSYTVQLVDAGGEYVTDLETVKPIAVSVNNEIYDYRELEVKPVLHETLKNMYEIDYENTTVTPDKIGVGVLPGTDIDELKIVIDEFSEEEGNFVIAPEEGLFIPEGSETVKIKLEFFDSVATDESFPE